MKLITALFLITSLTLTSFTADENVNTDPKPEFTYTDVNGKTVKLSDFRGKLVYIDVWATWCGPCRGQIPYLKKLEEDYHSEDVVFISLSVDQPKSKERWKKFVEYYSLGGVQLITENGFNSPFVQDFKINSIPRFILIDRDGTVIDENAPRPSMNRVRKLLDRSLVAE